MVPTRRQVLVRGLNGKTLCLDAGSGTLTGFRLRQLLSARQGIPIDHTWGVTLCSRRIRDSDVLFPLSDGSFPPLSQISFLLGGKGGFGSLLRGTATRAGQKKTQNFDACRDMSGRRVRHVNAEKQLKEWKMGSSERELEKIGQAYIKKLSKDREKKEVEEVDMRKVVRESKAATKEVAAAVAEAMKDAKRMGKRPADDQTEKPTGKKSKIMSLLENLEDSSEDDDDEGDGDEDDDEDADGEEGGDVAAVEAATAEHHVGEGLSCPESSVSDSPPSSSSSEGPSK